MTDDETPAWISPTQCPRILICHDETTFRSGEVPIKHWMMNNSGGFFSNNQGRSCMVSDFLVQHPSGSCFSLNNDEWNEAIKQYLTLDHISDVEYVERAGTASINIGTYYYFENNTTLKQSEPLFQLLEFKESQNHDIEIIVDNA